MRSVKLVAAALVFVAVAAAFVHRADRIESAWEARVEAAQQFAERETARADSLAQAADSAAARADSLAVVAVRMGERVRERVVEVRAVVVPDTCSPFVEPRDEIIDSLLAVEDGWRAAYAESVAAMNDYHASYEWMSAVADSLADVLDSRPRQRSRWIPSVGVGPFVGACATGPCAGLGVTLSWRIR